MLSQLREKIDWPLFWVTFGMGIIAPLIFGLLSVGPVIRFAVLLLLVNGWVSIYTGRRIRETKTAWYWLLWWPIIFLLGAYLWLPQYTLTFALVYISVTYMAFSFRK